MCNLKWLKLHVLKLYFANFEFSWVKELRKFIALIFIYYVFIDVLVAPLKI
jgi:transposase